MDPNHGNSMQGYPYNHQNQEATNGYGYSQSDNWQNSFPPSQQPSVPQPVPADSNINLRDIHAISRPTHDAPWTGGQSSHVSQLSPDQQRWAPNYQGPKAHSVAFPVSRNHQWQRPSNQTALTVSSDSGYESAKPTCLQRLPGIPEVPPPQDYFRFEAGPRPVSSPRGPLGSVRSDSHLEIPERRRRPKVQVPPCPHCGKELKNKSDADKHIYQHTKPFRCEEHGCTRKEGFATSNDLQRHRKSVHGADPTVGERNGHICRACPAPTLGTPPKWWPRLDNFKAHIKRKHLEWIEVDLIKISAALRPDDAVSESGYASQHGRSQKQEEQVYQTDLSSPVTPSAERQRSYQGDLALVGFGHFDDLVAGVGEGPLADPFTGRPSDTRFCGPSLGDVGNASSHGVPALGNVAFHPRTTSPVDSMISPSRDMPGSLPGIRVSQYDLESRQAMFSTLQWDQRRQKRQRLVSSLTANDDQVFGHADGEHKCPKCEKVKRRECDLRKHMKRHTRPYGCTFPSCTKRFGSRNDWKRHENSQHFLQEMWRCEYEGVEPGSKCGKLAYHQRTFAMHLVRKHADLLGESLDTVDQCRRMHLGREGHHHFWCGFCNRLIEQKDSIQQGAWDMRFKHIGDHFDKDNLHIDTWIDIEENKQKQYISNDDRKKEKTASGNEKIDDDSDLGDDGIPNVVPRFSVPVSYAPLGHDPGVSAQASMHRLNNRRLSGVNVDVDAENVSDSEWR